MRRQSVPHGVGGLQRLAATEPSPLAGAEHGQSSRVHVAVQRPILQANGARFVRARDYWVLGTCLHRDAEDLRAFILDLRKSGFTELALERVQVMTNMIFRQSKV